MPKLLCYRCGHEWTYNGKGKNTKCPHCMKYTNVSKALNNYRTKYPADTTETSEIKEVSSSTKTLDLSTKKIAVTDDKIEVEEVKTDIPPEFQERLKDDKIDDKKKPQVPAKPVEIPYKTIETLLNFPFDLWSDIEKDPEFKLSKMELNSLTPMVQSYLNQHMGDWFKGYSGEIAIAIIIGLILIKRVPYKMNKMKKAKQKQMEDQVIQAGSKIAAPSNPPQPEWMKRKFK